MEDLDLPIDKLMTMIKREMFSGALFKDLLLYYCAKNRDDLAKLISVATPAYLKRVYDILETYPWTEVGWSILPSSRETFLDANQSRNERADVQSRQYQEDRESVEYLREVIRPIPK